MPRFSSAVWVCVVLIVASGCSGGPVNVAVRQPMDFPHQPHVSYFSSGQHRTEKIQMHLSMFNMSEPPPELAEGRCAECHDDLAALAGCAGCHVPFQNAALRAKKEIRPCVACHRGAWTTSQATIPDTKVCMPCHERGARKARDAQNGTHVRLVRAGEPDGPQIENIPWVRINTLPPNVYFSHAAHVQFASMTCMTCHQDVRTLMSPPTRVRVFAMSDCLGCHAERGVSTDCLTCHK